MEAAKQAAAEAARKRMEAANASLQADMRQLELREQPPPSGPRRKSSFDYESAGRRLSMDL